MDLLTCLQDDHDTIRKYLQLLDETDDFQARRNLFADLFVAVRAHFRAEQAAVYSRCMNIKNSDANGMALDGYEDHRLLEDFVQKIRVADTEYLWNMRVKTFCQILELHLASEESDFFPELRRFLTSSERQRAAVLYLQTKKYEENMAGFESTALMDRQNYLN